jgi:proteasome alpha subunit
LGHNGDGEPRELEVDDLEVAVLDRTRGQMRKFARVRPTRLAELLATGG